MRIGTVNIASGRGLSGPSTGADGLAAAVAGLDVEVLAVQEVDVHQPRSHGVDQPAVLGAALGTVDGRFVPTVAGTPDPFRSWLAADSPGHPLDEAPAGPHYGIALLSRRPVRAWHVLPLGAGRAKLPIKAPDPRTGVPRWWWFPDEPRVAVAAELDGLTVVATHLSFAPHTALRQLLRLGRWARSLPGPVVVAGDLNLVGPVPGAMLGAQRLVTGGSYPADRPRVQFDHLLGLGALTAERPEARQLTVGDHRLLAATVRRG
ncbi:endonuclease [Modestobacter sp. I12A-02628]|uniref:Endonuclease n=1 Tax=Goekera deserti TaxID=2497753 RepID=A0A7K3WF33_9ACTN|nr:endonuclease [Goekera deserti]NDI48516.1 endonuclease [Goekera deserti]NEL55105.1 endonuclease [Goekera deserti]